MSISGWINCSIYIISSVQLLSCVRFFATPWTAACRLPCPSQTPGAYLNSCLSSKWCHPTISSSVVPFFHLQSFPASGSFQMSQFFASGGQSIGVSASASVLPMNIKRLISFRMDWLDLLAVQETLKSLLQYHSSKALILPCSAFFIVQLSHPYMTTGQTIGLTRWTFVGKVMSLLFNMLSRLVITFLPRSKHLSWLQSPSAVILEPPKIKSLTVEVQWSEVTQSCPNLCDHMDCSPPGSSVHGILQARMLEWVAISVSRGSSRPRDWTQVSRIAGRRFNLWATILLLFNHKKKWRTDTCYHMNEPRKPYANERSQVQSSCIICILFIGNVWNRQIHRRRKKTGGCQGLRWGARE